jgi:Nucleotidyl transferase of unknown function (DUF2204)
MTADDVRAVLARNQISHILIGGHAVAARGYPRFTSDVDFLTTESRSLDVKLWAGLAEAGARIDSRRGDFDDPLAGVVHITLPDEHEVDVVVGKWKWEQEVIDRAEPLDVAGMTVPVPRASDLILLKLAAGGYHDLNDAAILLAVNGPDSVAAEVNERIGRLPKDAQAAWRRILSERT